MRVGVVALASVLFAGACETSLSLHVQPQEQRGGALGIGLAEPYTFAEATGEQCGYVLCPDDPTPRHFSVTVVSGSAVGLDQVADHGDGSGSFLVKGVVSGTARIAIKGDGIDEYQLSFEAAPVVSASLVARRRAPGGNVDLGDVNGPLAVLAGSQLEIAASYSDGRSPLVGFAPLSVAASNTQVALTNASCLQASCVFSAGSVAGSTSITTSVGGSVDIDVVDPSAIADFSLAPSDPGVLHLMGDAAVLYLLPVTADHRPILGNGNPVQIAVGDAFIVQAGVSSTDSRAPALVIEPRELGTTTIDLTWGQVHHQIAVTVDH